MKKGKDNLGDRMKKYESVNKTQLIPKLYTVIRLDGKAFHTYTKQFKKPFDNALINLMDETAIYLCSKIQGAKFAFVQSDEISIFISDMDSLEQQMWFDGEIQKIVSVAASMASAKFNHLAMLNKIELLRDKDARYTTLYDEAMDKLEEMSLAEFDARVFQLPNIDELINCYIWRQQDCIRNSISSVAQHNFSSKELHKKSTRDMKEMLVDIKDPWENYEEKQKNGRLIIKNLYINDELASTNISDDDTSTIWYQPNGNGLYPSKLGRALKYCMSFDGIEDWCDIQIEKIRSKWESVACPELVINKQFLKDKI